MDQKLIPLEDKNPQEQLDNLAKKAKAISTAINLKYANGQEILLETVKKFLTCLDEILVIEPLHPVFKYFPKVGRVDFSEKTRVPTLEEYVRTHTSDGTWRVLQYEFRDYTSYNRPAPTFPILDQLLNSYKTLKADSEIPDYGKYQTNGHWGDLDISKYLMAYIDSSDDSLKASLDYRGGGVCYSKETMLRVKLSSFSKSTLDIKSGRKIGEIMGGDYLYVVEGENYRGMTSFSIIHSDRYNADQQKGNEEVPPEINITTQTQRYKFEFIEYQPQARILTVSIMKNSGPCSDTSVVHPKNYNAFDNQGKQIFNKHQSIIKYFTGIGLCGFSLTPETMVLTIVNGLISRKIVIKEDNIGDMATFSEFADSLFDLNIQMAGTNLEISYSTGEFFGVNNFITIPLTS